ncbi:MAG: extracellular solute-binding protein [Ardenticatenaceae bacterium]|nr:extracellular solute-binding protein [Ardenticatenaceae bacterium]
MKMYRKVAVLWVSLVLPLILAFVLVACGGGEEAETEPNADEPATSDEEASEPETADTTTDDVVFPDEPLLVLEWSGYTAPEVPYMFVPFTEKYTPTLEAAVEYTLFADDAEAFTKMQTNVGADLVHPCHSWWGLYVEAGLLQPIDTSRLSNWSGIHPELAALGNFNGEQYFVPWDWGYESILVRTDLVENVPESWADVWSDEYAGHVVPWDSAESNFVMAGLSLGIEDPVHATPEQDEQIKQHLLDLKSNILTYWVDYTEAYDLPQTGDAWILTNTWPDAYGYLLSEGYEVAYVNPTEKRLGWVCGYGIGKDATNLDLIYEYLDSAISPDSMAALANVYWYGAANQDALPLIDEFPVEFMELDQMDTLFERTYFPDPISEEKRQIMVGIWDEVKAAP